MTVEESYSALERTLLARNRELERRIVGMEELYDKACADLIEALDVAVAYRATASSLYQEIERRTGVERRQMNDIGLASRHGWRRGGAVERRKSWPR